MTLFTLTRIFFSALFMLSLLNSCAPKSKKTEAKIKLFSSFSATGLNMNGGALIYGETLDGSKSFSRVYKGASEFSVNIDYGDWNFSVITYAGPNEMEGAIECATDTKSIRLDQNEVDLTVSPSKCPSAGMRGLSIKPCSNANFTTVATGGVFSTCGGVGGDGTISSYKLALKAHDGGVLLPGGLFSSCIEAINFEDPPLIIPTGLTGASKVPARLRLFTGAGCTGNERIVDIRRSPSNPIVQNLFHARAAGAILRLAINLDGPGIDTAPPPLTLTTTEHNDGTNTWINLNNQASFNVSGVCEDGIPIIARFNGGVLPESPITCSAGVYTFNVDLSAYPERSSGPHYDLRVLQTDPAGNTAAPSLALYKDTINPSGSVTFSPIKYRKCDLL